MRKVNKKCEKNKKKRPKWQNRQTRQFKCYREKNLRRAVIKPCFSGVEGLAKQGTDIFIPHKINRNQKIDIFSFKVVFVLSTLSCFSCIVNIIELNISIRPILGKEGARIKYFKYLPSWIYVVCILLSND